MKLFVLRWRTLHGRSSKVHSIIIFAIFWLFHSFCWPKPNTIIIIEYVRWEGFFISRPLTPTENRKTVLTQLYSRCYWRLAPFVSHFYFEVADFSVECFIFFSLFGSSAVVTTNALHLSLLPCARVNANLMCSFCIRIKLIWVFFFIFFGNGHA